ncbi:MAG: alpha-L-fucosidase [Verrucomicrobiota bacterium]
MKTKKLLLSVALALAGFVPAVLAQPDQSAKSETKEQHDARMSWWRDAKFGMFIHWGVYSVPAGDWNGKSDYAEWIMEQGEIPVSRYALFAKEFNPVKFDAKAWVKTAKDAGMKYIVITSKHHDGFGLWPSAETDWCIKSTPFHRDPLRELSDACRQAGIKFCVYYSIMDWHSSDWGKRRAWNDVATGTPDMDRYTAYMKAQLKEIISNYHPAVIWFDGEWESPWTQERGLDLYAYLRALDPQLIINNRIGKGRGGMEGMDTSKEQVGDFGTPEQQVPPSGFGKGVDWESCMTLNDHWGYNQHDQNWKSPELIIQNLCDIASKGGNYLLNVGPTSEGLIPPPSRERLGQVGAWLRVNGEAIYGSGPTPFGAEAGRYSDTAKDKDGKPEFIPAWDWRCTTKPGKMYITIFKWPANGQLELPGLQSKVNKAYLLADRKKLKVIQNSDGVTISVTQKAPDRIASVVCLEIGDSAAQVTGKK